MRTFRFIVAAVLSLLCACRRQEVPDVPEPPVIPETPQLVEHTLIAYTPREDAPETRTVLDAANDQKILWSLDERISIFSEGGNYPFRGDNTAPAASASFSGTGPADLGNYIALYPYKASANYDNGFVSTSLAAGQAGKAGSFADGYLITADDASGNSISFNHVCSGLRFMVSRNDISAVSVRGNNGEKIAGDFRFSFTSADTPEAEAGTEEVVTLTAPDGCFETGKYYYIVILPTVFSKGFTLTADSGTQVGELRFGTEVNFSRGAFKNITGMLDERMTWSMPGSLAYYGPENSICLRPGESTSFDVSPRKMTDAWQRSGLAASSSPVPDGAETLWGNSVASLNLNGTTLTVTAAAAGSSLIAITKGGIILWSYLIWVTDNAPEETELPGGARILPALGGNCYFQWGRKDPLLHDCVQVSNQAGNGLDFSISHPHQFIQGGTSSPYDWYCADAATQDATLWGGDGTKTVWDPCPAGYRVPSEADFTHTGFDFNYLEGNFQELGYIGESMYWSQSRTYWTRTPSGSFFSVALDDTGFPEIFFGQQRSIACPVRCVKE